MPSAKQIIKMKSTYSSVKMKWRCFSQSFLLSATRNPGHYAENKPEKTLKGGEKQADHLDT